MTTSTFYAVAIFVGVVAGTYLPLNGRLGTQLGSPLLATTVFFLVGALAATVAWTLLGKGDTVQLLKTANPALFGLGVERFGIILSATFLIPRMGPGAYFVCIVAGQVVVGLLLSHFGLFAPEKLPLTPLKVLGAVAVIGGVVLIHYAERTERAHSRTASSSQFGAGDVDLVGRDAHDRIR